MVEQVDLDRNRSVDGVANAGNGRRIGLRALKESAVPAEDLVAGVAGGALESGIHEDDGDVRQVRVGDDHRHPRGPEGRGERVRSVDGAGDLRGDPLLFGKPDHDTAPRMVQCLTRCLDLESDPCAMKRFGHYSLYA